MKRRVLVTRTHIGSAIIEVEGKTEEEIKKIALDSIGNIELSLDGSDIPDTTEILGKERTYGKKH